MSYQLAVQLYTLRDEIENDFEGTIQQLADMGWAGVEMIHLPNRDADGLRQCGGRVVYRRAR